MTLQWIKTFISVIDNGSFAAAARMLHMTQSAVSMNIAALENDLGQTLLIRTPGQRTRIQPTPEGKVFLAFARKSLQDYSQMRIDLLQNRTFLPFRIGTSPTPGSSILPVLTGSFRQKFPQIRIEILAHPGIELVQRLKQKEFDIAVTGIPVRDTNLTIDPFFYDPLQLVCPSKYCPSGTITLHQLRKLPLVIRNPKCYTMQLLTEALNNVGLNLEDLNVVSQVYGNTDVLQAISLGSGCGFVTRSLIYNTSVPYHDISIVSVKRLKLNRYLHLVCLSKDSLSPGAALFRSYALDDTWRTGNFSYNTWSDDPS